MAARDEAALIGAAGVGPPRLRARLGPWLRDECLAQADRWPLWTPVAAGCGAAGYFALPIEPSVALAVAAGLAGLGLALAAAIWGRSRTLIVVAAVAGFAAAGFAVAALRTHAVAAPVAAPNLGAVKVEGFVLDVVSASAERPRILVAPTWIQGLAPQATPARIRVTLRAGVVGPGQAIRVLALVNPPPPPASPGACA